MCAASVLHICSFHLPIIQHSICCLSNRLLFFFFFFNDTATTEIYTLSLHDALPICNRHSHSGRRDPAHARTHVPDHRQTRSEEHTSELQSRLHLVCRLLLEKKKKNKPIPPHNFYPTHTPLHHHLIHHKHHTLC